MKYKLQGCGTWLQVALFTRAWIEITCTALIRIISPVALFTRAWIEIAQLQHIRKTNVVALFTRAWIEIDFWLILRPLSASRPLHEGVD